MLSTKNFHIKKQSVTFTLEGECTYLHNLNKYEAVSLALLTGFYNPMRRYSDNDKPIDIKKLAEFKERFKDLINEVISEMEVDLDVEEITKVR